MCFLACKFSRKTAIKFQNASVSCCFKTFENIYTLHKPVRYNFPRNRVIVTGVDEQWQADLVDMSSLALFNKGYKFLLMCIDVF